MIIDDLQPLFPGLIKDPNGASVVKDDLKRKFNQEKRRNKMDTEPTYIYIYITYM